MMARWSMVLMVLLADVSGALAKVVYVDNSLSANCIGATFNAGSRSCTGDDGPGYQTFAAAIPTLVPGDTLYVMGGTYAERMNFQDAGVTGAAGAYLLIAGYPGQTVILRTTSASPASYGPIKVRGSGFGWFIFRNLTLDGINETDNTMWQIRDGNHDFILEDLIIENFASTSLLIKNVTNITIRRCIFRNTRNISASSFYGTYFSVGSNVTIEDSEYYGNGGGGMHFYPGPISGLTVRRNRIHDNNNRTGGNLPVGGIAVYEAASTSTGDGGPITGVSIYDNLIYNNGTIDGIGNGGSGVYLGGQLSTDGPDGTKIYNNTIYGHNGGTTGWSQGIRVVTSGTTNTQIINNIVTNNQHGQVENAGVGTTSAYNGCLSSDACGTTGKVTLSSPLSCFVSSTDFRLAVGANQCVDVGTSVPTRTGVNAPDLGPFERGFVAAANALAAGGIEVELALSPQGARPSSGITGVSIACAGCTGSPTVVSANVKPGSSNTIILELAGITSDGGCTFTLAGDTNLTDSGGIGTPPEYQQVNQEFGLPVNGTCKNSSAPSILPTWSLFTLSEGSGTTANDSSGNGHHGTVSAGVVWINDLSGTGVSFPADTTYRQIATTFGAGMNPTTQSFAQCVFVLPDQTSPQKVVFSSGSNGSSQRWYAGWYTVAGQRQWGIGIQGSGFSSGSEFPVVAQKTLVCLVNDSATSTAALWVNGVKGTMPGQSVKSFTSYTLVGNLITGNDGTFTTNNGGFTVYEVYTWNTKPSDSDLSTLYAELTTVGSSGSCYRQVTHQAQLVHLDSAGAQVNYGPVGVSSVEVVDGGAVYLKIQIDCTGANGTTITPTPYYSVDGTLFAGKVPGLLGADGIAMWGASADPTLNMFAAACCLSGALTGNNGVTIVTESGGQAITLSQNHSYTVGLIVKFAPGQVGQSFWIKLYQGNGQPLAGGYTPSSGVKVTIVSPRESGVF